jgi:hypothetical protein
MNLQSLQIHAVPESAFCWGIKIYQGPAVFMEQNELQDILCELVE